MVCKGVCIRYKVTKKGINGFRYAGGQKRCNYCGVYMMWDGRHCPCCGYSLRTKPRFRKYKEKLRRVQDMSLERKREF